MGDPYAALGLKPGASEAEIHAAYRAAVRRTHPDAGGSASAFEAVQEAYESLRDPARRPHPQTTAPPPPRTPPIDADAARRNMDDLLAESQRLEDEARRLAGLHPLHEPDAAGEEDSVGAVLRDAGSQLRDIADEGARELRRFLRRMT